MNTRYVESFINFSENTNNIFSTILSILNSQQQTYNNLLNRNNDRNSNISSNISRNILQQTLLRNLLMRIPSENNLNNSRNNIPTQEQINFETTTTRFSDIENPINSTCPISQIDFQDSDTVIQINECRHIFSQNSLLQWFNRNNCCPMCRYSITQNNNNNSSNLSDLDNTTGSTNSDEINNQTTRTNNINNSTSNDLRNLINRTREINLTPYINSNNNNGSTTINNELLSQLQNIIDTFNQEIQFEVALITPSE